MLEELYYLNPYLDILPKEIFFEEFKNPITDGSGYMRLQLQEASKLLKASGWELVEGKLVHSSSNELFESTKLNLFLVSNSLINAAPHCCTYS